VADAGLRLADVNRGPRLQFTCDGEPVQAYAGETIAAALLADGRRVLRQTSRTGSPRGLFCAMGVCFECLMTVDGVGGVRTCMTPVRDGAQVSTAGSGQS
jgi:predicted molibdopterin-dependent oxidoreductase YjgC